MPGERTADGGVTGVKSSLTKGTTSRQEIARGLSLLWSRLRGLRLATVPQQLRETLSKGWWQIRRAPVTTFLTVVTISVTLTLLGAIMVLLTLIQGLGQSVPEGPTLTIFLREGTTETVARRLADDMTAVAGVTTVEYLTAEQVLERFRSGLGDDEMLLEGLEEKNPLPQAVIVHVRGIAGESTQLLSELKSQILMRREVEYAHFPEETVRQLSGLLFSLRRVAFLGAMGMVITCFVVILNTIRLALFSYRAEIEVVQLLGGTSGFIQGPFLVEGMFHGLAGGVLAIFFLEVITRSTSAIVGPVAILQSLGGSVVDVPAHVILVLLVAGVFAGLVGSFTAVAYHLK